MREQYDFSAGTRGKYVGKVDTTNIRLLDSAKPARKQAASALMEYRRADPRAKEISV